LALLLLLLKLLLLLLKRLRLLMLLLMMMMQLLRLLLLVLDRRLGSRVTQTPVKFAPRVQRLVRPDPKSGRDADDQSHEIPGKGETMEARQKKMTQLARSGREKTKKITYLSIKMEKSGRD
jgi:hypothetical protein